MSEQQERIIGALAGGLAVVGAFLPWVKVQSIFGTLSFNGIDDGRDGIFTALLGALAALVLLVARSARWPPILAIVCGLIITAIGIYDLSNVRDGVGDINAEGEGFARASTGAGLYLTVVAGIVLTICAVLATRRPAASVPQTENHLAE